MYPLVYYGAGFIALIIGSVCAGKILAGKIIALKFPAIWLCVFVGLIGGASIGNFFGQILHQWTREFWIPLIIVSPVERAIFSFGAALVGVPLLAGLHKTGIFAGPQLEAEDIVLEQPAPR